MSCPPDVFGNCAESIIIKKKENNEQAVLRVRAGTACVFYIWRKWAPLQNLGLYSMMQMFAQRNTTLTSSSLNRHRHRHHFFFVPFPFGFAFAQPFLEPADDFCTVAPAFPEDGFREDA